MRKTVLCFALSSLLFFPQTARPISSKTTLSVSIALAIAGSIATTYCYAQERNMLTELEKLNLTGQEIENAVIETTPSEIAALKELMEQNTADK